MKIAFLGGVFYPEMIDSIYKNTNGMPDMAANALQWKTVSGLEENLGTSIRIVNAPFIASYPKGYKKWHMQGGSYQHSDKSEDINVSFINIFAVRNVFIKHALKKAIKAILKKADASEPVGIVVYALHSPWVEAAYYAKRIHPNCKTCFIVTDLPEYMNLNSNVSWLYRFLKKIDRHKIQKCIDACDSFVLLTDSMKVPLQIGEKPYVVIEGMTASHSDVLPDTESFIQKRTVVYTGTLNYAYGIKNLLDSMEYISDNNIRLVICGNGEAKGYIEELEKKDQRIQYKGVLDPADTAELQRKATVLVNPRTNEGEYTKYSFPSKVLEYLSSGRPTVMYKLDGIPAEYDQYVFYIDGNTPQAIAETLQNVLSMDIEKLNGFGKEAQEFALSQKNNVTQTAKILDMINRL